MQLNDTELRLIESAIPSESLPTIFQLPALHPAIPRVADYVKYPTDFATLGRELLAAQVIDPADVGDDALTPKKIVEDGLKAWFMRRIGLMHHVRFDVAVVDAEHANAYVSDFESGPTHFVDAALAFTGDVAEMRYVEKIARAVEAVVPGLFLVAYTELIEAGYLTVEIHCPQRVIEMEMAYSLWGNDITSVTDEEARECLEERYGEEVDSSDYYMPDTVLRALGNGFCYDIARRGQKRKKPRRFSDLQLKKLAKHENVTVADIAAGLLNLRKARTRVSRLGAQMPHTSMMGGRPQYVSSIIFFNEDDRVLQFMDDEHQHLMETGEGTDLYAIEQLPTTAAELKTYFQKLDALFGLIAQMDALIPKISYTLDQE